VVDVEAMGFVAALPALVHIGAPPLIALEHGAPDSRGDVP
jgi:hypothetical protein